MADCKDCVWENWEDDAEDKARDHAANEGHDVTVYYDEQEGFDNVDIIVYSWDEKEDRPL